MKGKRVGKKDANTRQHTDVLSKNKPKNLVKNLFAALQAVIDPLDNQLGIHGLARDPPSLIYPLYLSPPSSYSNKASWNCVLSSSLDPATSSMLHLPSLASSNASQ